MRFTRRLIFGAAFLLAVAVAGPATAAPSAPDAPIIHDASQAWTPAVRARFYHLDQGSRLIPMAWLEALRQQDGTPFMANSLARYGFLSGKGADDPNGLPVGVSVAASAEGPVAGLTCAACHTRDIKSDGRTFRIEGAPALIDFQSFLADLDAAVIRALATDASFGAFAHAVLGGAANDRAAVSDLHARVGLWSLRFHTWLRALPEHPWGPSRLDAFGMIFNRLGGLDLGTAPSYLIPENIAKADAPARYPFLWNAAIQDRTDWAGFAANGNDQFALARNIGEVLGVFAVFHPRPTPKGAPLDRDYLSQNSSNIAGLAELEAMVVALKPPTWPWPVDTALAEKGHAIFDLPTEQGGCVDCHGIKPGANRGPRPTWKTPVLDVGTDTRMWDILRREAKSGSLAGAYIPGVTEPLPGTAPVADLLKTAVVGIIAQAKARNGTGAAKPAAAQTAAMADAVRLPGRSAKALPKGEEPAAAINRYESRVLEGIWAAAPYLHNGSVPTLADLLKTSAERPKAFKIGPAYDREGVGLAADQSPSAFVLHTTGCDDLRSGDSHCGHEYGTHLSGTDKKALLEYLKTL